MHHLCRFGEDRTNNNLDTGLATRSGPRRRGHSIKLPPDFVSGELKNVITDNNILISQIHFQVE